MIAYFESSALAKLVLAEPGSALAHEVWEAADSVVCSRVGYVELHSALAAAIRSRRLSRARLAATVDRTEYLWRMCDKVEVDDGLVRAAAALTHRHGLAGYDALHLAAAESFRGAAHMVTWDRRVAAAAVARGVPAIGEVRG